MENETLTSTIERTLSVLELFIQNPEGLNPQEILEKRNISRSTLFTILKELKEIGYLDQTETRGRYIAGPRLLSWSASSTPSLQLLINVFEQETSTKKFTETIALAVPGPQGIILLAQKEADQLIRSVFTIGEPLPKNSAVNRIISPPFEENVIQCGYFLNSTPEFLELAIPICANGIDPVGGIILNAPKYRWREELFLDHWLPELRAMAARISYRLGALQYSPYHQDQGAPLQPTSAMNNEQINQFLMGPWTARLACIRPDGNPHVIPVWHEWDGEKFSILALQGSQWVDYVRKNPQVSLTIDEPWSPYRRVVSRGIASEINGSEDHAQPNLISRLAKRYLGQQSSQSFSHQVETIFSIKPEGLRGWMGLSNKTI